MEPTSPHKGRTALVTGANKGIGFHVAKNLAKLGMTVYLGTRDSSRGQAAVDSLTSEGLDARFVLVDVNRPETAVAAAEKISSECGSLDVLVNNAGIVDPLDGSPTHATIEGVRRVFDTNFFGVIAVTQEMLPLIRKSKAGRIVNVSSGLGSLTINGDPNSGIDEKYRLVGYAGSKAALNMFTVQLAMDLKSEGILVNAADPGYTATDLNGHQGYQTIEEGSEETIRLATLPDGDVTGTFSDRAGIRPW